MIMKKTLLLSVTTFVLSMFSFMAKAETETKVLLDVDFAGGIPEGWTVVGDVQAAEGAAVVAAGAENYILSPELDLSVAGEAGIFKITKLRAGLTAADAEVPYTTMNVNKEYDEQSKSCTSLMLTGVDGPYKWADAEGYNNNTIDLTDNISAQACASQKIRLKFFCAAGYAFKLKEVKVTCEVEKVVDEPTPDTKETVLLINEDFSKFTLPSPADLSDAVTDEVPAKYTNEAGWLAHGIIAMDGKARLQSTKDYIQTPYFDFSGNTESRFSVTLTLSNPSDVSALFMYIKARYVNAAGETVEVVGLDKPTDKAGYYVMVGAGAEEKITKHFQISKDECPSQRAAILVHDFYNGSEFIIDDVQVSQIQDTIPTGIAAAELTPANQNTAVYNIMGQKVNANSRGLIIKNGKLYLKK